MKMEKMSEVKQVGRDLIVGILVYGILVQGILLLFPARMYHAIGLWIGVIIGLVSSVHMRISLEDTVGLDEKSASDHIRRRAMLRYFGEAVVIGVVLYFQIGSILTVLIGILGLKISAYLQPVTRKVICKFIK